EVAVGSNMAIGCLTAFSGALTALCLGGGLDLLTLALVAPPTCLGGYLGARLTGRFRKETLQRLVGWTIAATGLLMVGQGAWPAARTDAAPGKAQTATEPPAPPQVHTRSPGWQGARGPAAPGLRSLPH